MSKSNVAIERGFTFRSFHTDESGEWECSLSPDDPEPTQIAIRAGGIPGNFEMSVETARAIAHVILAAVEQHDANRRFNDVIASINSTSQQKEHTNG